MNSNMNPIYSIARGLLIAALVMSVLFSLASHSYAYAGNVPQRADTDVLKQCAFRLWQQINAARQNPLATAARLEIPEHIVRQTFSTQPWVLDRGLPPLAWNQSLHASASAHGRDMFNRVYYSYVSPEGVTYWDRIQATDYAPEDAGETLSALFFENFMPLEESFELIVNSMLRDELTGNPSVERNIFNPDFIEMGAAFYAESTPLLGDQPYVYLLVADFARPLEARAYAIGTYPLDCSVVMHPLLTGGWFQVRTAPATMQLPVGMFQVVVPHGGADFILVSENGLGAPVDYVTVVAPSDHQCVVPHMYATNANAVIALAHEVSQPQP
ncbi:MAG: CAP domain-containing protein [Desulfuromonadaceae bacterium]|nr:CAP domain-containing protein [Desulfuromonadaceae bacterium]